MCQTKSDSRSAEAGTSCRSTSESQSSKGGKSENDNVDKYPLHTAVRECNYKNLKELLSDCSSSVVEDIDGLKEWESALDVAATLGDYQATLMLLQAGAKPAPRSTCSRPIPTFRNALKGGNVEVIASLIAHGCDPNFLLSSADESDSCENWPLGTFWDCALATNNLEVVKCLLDHYPDVISDEDKFRRLLVSSVDRNSSGIVELLLKLGAPLKPHHGKDRYREALIRGLTAHSLHIFQLLLRHGADPNVQVCESDEGSCLLHLAIQLGKPEFLRILLGAGAKVDVCSEKYGTPLHYALRLRCSSSMLGLLLRAGADANALDPCSGWTPVQLVLNRTCSLISLLDLLLAHGVDLEVRDARGGTALHLAAVYSARALGHLLLKAKPRVDLKDKKGRTALQQAVKYKNLDSIGCLLDYGADVRPLKLADPLRNKLLDERVRRELTEGYVRHCIAGLKVEPELKTLSKYHGKLEEYGKRCVEEMTAMQKTMLHRKVTLYDLLHADNEKLVALARQPKVQQMFQTQKHQEGLPIYANLLNSRFATAERLEQHYDAAATSLLVMSEFRFPSRVLHRILQHLDQSDIAGLAEFNLL